MPVAKKVIAARGVKAGAEAPNTVGPFFAGLKPYA